MIAPKKLRRGLFTLGAAFAVSASQGFAQQPVATTPAKPAIAATAPAIVQSTPIVTTQVVTDLTEVTPSFGGSLLERPKLTGDWGGLRNDLAQSGITIDASVTTFFQGVTRGGLDREFENGYKGDYLLGLDTTKMGLWQGGLFSIRAETHLGQSINGIDGALLPANIPMSLPANKDITAITGFTYTQFLSETFGVYVGKINTLDGDQNAFASGRGLTQFMNTAFVFNPIAARSTPYSTLGAGFIVLKNKEPILNVGVLNAVDTSTTAGFNELFEKGAVFAAELRLPTTFFDRPGHQLIGATYSTRQYTSLDPSNYLSLPVAGGLPTESGSWCIYYNFDQYLYVDPCNPKRGWGVFGRAGFSDQQANPFDYFVSFGIGGNSPLSHRENDTFGIGWFYTGLSGGLKALPLGLGNEDGFELYYNIAVTPWCHITPDVQIINSSPKALETAVILGLRAKFDF